MNRQDACEARKFTLRFTGILPVLEKGGRCEVFPTAQHAIDNYI